ncbi:MAG: DMT family transporter [Chloroflexota bacterium]
MTPRVRNGILFALLAAAGYAFFPIFTKLIYQYSDFGAVDIAGWRFMMAVPLAWLALYARNHTIGHPNPTERLPRLQLLGLGVLLATGALAAFYGLALIEAGVYVMLFRTYPMMVLLLSMFLGESLPERAWLALLLVVVGVGMMILNPGQVNFELSSGYFIGIGVAFYNAIAIAFYNVIQQRVIEGKQSKVKASAWTLTGSLLTMLPIMTFMGLAPFPNWQTFFSVLGHAIVSTVVPLIAIYEGISRIGASRFVLIGSVEPLMALIWAYLLFGEVLTPLQLGGGLLILLSIVVLEARFPRRRRATVAAAAGD